MGAQNPFLVDICGQVCQTMASDDRIRMVKSFDAAQCHAALALPNLQKTVRLALERRLRQLAKAEKAA
jgi:hypothetical protein